MNEKKIIKIPIEVKHLFNQEYLDFELAEKIIMSESTAMKEFINELIPIIKSYVEKKLPIIKMLNLL